VSGISTILVGSGRGDLDAYLGSLARIRDIGARTLFPAHGPPMIAPREAIQETIDHRWEREAKIVAALGAGAKSVSEIVELAYSDTPEAPAALAAQQALCHLTRLEDHGRVRQVGPSWELV
jgi:glyoxylase-like metal-dependent hydrolase (beta-lactamase superfamily II)